MTFGKRKLRKSSGEHISQNNTHEKLIPIGENIEKIITKSQFSL